MKLKLSFKDKYSNRAGTLMVTLAVTTLLGLALTTYLKLVTSQNQMVARSQIWNECMPILEAGIEEALTHCQNNYLTNMASNGWQPFSGTYVKSNVVADGYFLTAISQSVPYVIVSQGFNQMPGGEAYISRTVRVTTAPHSVFTGAMVMRNTIRMNGNNISTDSYDSEDDEKSTGGMYDPTKAGDNGDVGSAGGLRNSFSAGNANIKGQVLTAPGGEIRIGPNGTVGSTQWHAAGNTGIQPGWHLVDMNMDFPPVEAPFVSATPPPIGTVGGTNYNYVLGGGNYMLPSLSGNVIVQGDATLYVTGDVNFGNSDFLIIEPGAKLQLYVGGAKTTINTVVNNSGNAKAFTYFGLESNKELNINGNSTMSAAFYAPNAEINFNGNIDFYGSLIANDAALNGNAAFHFDEALGRIPPRGAVIITSWNEI